MFDGHLEFLNDVEYLIFGPSLIKNAFFQVLLSMDMEGISHFMQLSKRSEDSQDLAFLAKGPRAVVEGAVSREEGELSITALRGALIFFIVLSDIFSSVLSDRFSGMDSAVFFWHLYIALDIRLYCYV